MKKTVPLISFLFLIRFCHASELKKQEVKEDKGVKRTTIHRLTENMEDPELLSAFLGLNETNLPFRLRGCTVANSTDAMPVVFSHEIDSSTLRPDAFQVTSASGRVTQPSCTTLGPACDKGEARTVLLIGDLDRIDDPPINVKVISDIRSIDGSLSFEGQEISVIPFEDGPSLILAQIIPENQWELGRRNFFRSLILPTIGTNCPQDTKQIIRATWNGGITKPSGEEVDDNERLLYTISVQNEGGEIVEIHPFALADLNDMDNNHKLCLDVLGTPLSISFPAGFVQDPAGHLNKETAVNVTMYH